MLMFVFVGVSSFYVFKIRISEQKYERLTEPILVPFQTIVEVRHLEIPSLLIQYHLH